MAIMTTEVLVTMADESIAPMTTGNGVICRRRYSMRPLHHLVSGSFSHPSFFITDRVSFPWQVFTSFFLK